MEIGNREAGLISEVAIQPGSVPPGRWERLLSRKVKARGRRLSVYWALALPTLGCQEMAASVPVEGKSIESNLERSWGILAVCPLKVSLWNYSSDMYSAAFILQPSIEKLRHMRLYALCAHRIPPFSMLLIFKGSVTYGKSWSANID
jgi:hypothetical protein